VAANVIEHGTGALNVDACRVATDEVRPKDSVQLPHDEFGTFIENGGRLRSTGSGANHTDGRWPSNVALSHSGECGDVCQDGCTVAELDAQSGITRAGERPARRAGIGYGSSAEGTSGVREVVLDSGGASRYFPTFRYQAKAPTKERPKVDGVSHPTVKPLALMRWLVRLVTPPGGLVLDPFAGSGSTVEAALLEGFDVIGIEREADYLPLIQARVDRAMTGQGDLFATPA
jgi:site-specific DNA-methyltransferase (adenine-specific)